MEDLDKPNCCGRKVTTPYCPTCGRKQFLPSDPLALLSYLKGQRNKTAAWVTRCERHLGCLSKEEAERRATKHRATLARWDAWIEWLKARLEAIEDIPL
jgi:hypothetical protein